MIHAEGQLDLSVQNGRCKWTPCQSRRPIDLWPDAALAQHAPDTLSVAFAEGDWDGSPEAQVVGGVNPNELTAVLGTATADGLLRSIDVRGLRFVDVRTSTHSATGGEVRVVASANRWGDAASDNGAGEPSYREPIFGMLGTTGLNSGTTNAIGNYSGGATDFKVAPASGEVFNIARMIVSMETSGTFDSGRYGGKASPGTLSNGIEVQVRDASAAVVDLTAAIPITVNGHWTRFCYDLTPYSFGGGNSVMSVRWTFTRAGQRQGLQLNGADGEFLTVRLHDDFTGLLLASQYFHVQGYKQAG